MDDDTGQGIPPRDGSEEVGHAAPEGRRWRPLAIGGAVAAAGVIAAVVLLSGGGGGKPSDAATAPGSSDSSGSSTTVVPGRGGSSSPGHSPNVPGHSGATGSGSSTAATSPPTTVPPGLKPNSYPTPSSPPPPPPSKDTTTTAAPGTLPGQHLFTSEGVGSQDVDLAGAPANWNVQWTFTCGSGAAPGFAYTVSGPAGTSLVGPTQSETSGSGTEQYHGAGNFTLHVATACNWTMTGVVAA